MKLVVRPTDRPDVFGIKILEPGVEMCQHEDSFAFPLTPGDVVRTLSRTHLRGGKRKQVWVMSPLQKIEIGRVLAIFMSMNCNLWAMIQLNSPHIAALFGNAPFGELRVTPLTTMDDVIAGVALVPPPGVVVRL